MAPSVALKSQSANTWRQPWDGFFSEYAAFQNEIGRRLWPSIDDGEN